MSATPSPTPTKNAAGAHWLGRLVRLSDECDQFATTLSLHRDKFPQVWKSFVELWNGNEDIWQAIGVQKLGHIEATADASFQRYTRNHGHHVSFLEHACAQLAAALRSEANVKVDLPPKKGEDSTSDVTGG